MTPALVAAVLAFTAPVNFQAPAQYGGGNGNRFTGSPGSHWNCGACHVADPKLSVEVTADGRDLHGQGYAPGETYSLVVTLSDAAKASAFALEIVDANGEAAGTLALPPPPTGDQSETFCPDGFTSIVELEDGAKVAQSNACRPGLTVWRVEWTAPDTDVGPVTMYLDAVAGDGDGTNVGDRSAAQVLGVPSPGTPKTTGCSSVPVSSGAAFSLLAGMLLFARRKRFAAMPCGGSMPTPPVRREDACREEARRVASPSWSLGWRVAGVLLIAVTLAAPGAALAKTKRKRHKKRPPATKPVVKREPPPEPEAPPPEPTPPEPAPAVEAPPPPAETVAPAPPPAPLTVETFKRTVRDTTREPVAFECSAAAGAGLRNFHIASTSLATPLGVALAYPEVALGFTAYPLRLLSPGSTAGLQLEGAYQVGWAFSAKVSNATSVAPSDAWLTLGWGIPLGPVELVPRALWRMQVGGVERNAELDDGWFQSVGGELGIRVRAGALLVEVRPRGGLVLDAGTVPARGYGAFAGGMTYGGLAQVGLALGSGPWRVALRYAFSHTEARFSGGGVRQLAPVAFTDTTQGAQVSIAADL